MKVDTGLSMTATADSRSAAAEAERAGYAAVWTSEVKHDPFVALALAATATERVELGSAIAVAFARNPMTTAVQANDLQLLSRGRLRRGDPAGRDGPAGRLAGPGHAPATVRYKDL